ncbi:synaptic vesicular amine transporter-like [Tubulanus polymorphus]|uniref:synaptic vesicular amine transporter-like n=1 Tax=Tubulanus polymorphus TaxID=672921 RepID=UPI003DA6C99E
MDGHDARTSFRQSKALVVVVAFVSLSIYASTSRLSAILLPVVVVELDSSTETTNATTYADLLYGKKVTSSANHVLGYTTAMRYTFELIFSLVSGVIVDKFGWRWPRCASCLINAAAMFGMAFASSTPLLVAIGALQGIGLSLTSVSSLASLGETFSDDTERNKALGKSLVGHPTGQAFSIIIGPLLFEYFDLESPSLVLAVFCIFGGLLALLSRPKDKALRRIQEETGSATYTLFLYDPYITLGLLTNFTFYFGVSIYATVLFEWLYYDLTAALWQITVVLLTCMPLMVAGNLLTGYFGNSHRWAWIVAGMWFYSAGMATYPTCASVWHVLAPEGLVRIGLGIFPCSINSTLARVADERYSHATYGAIYGLSILTMDLGYILGPLFAGFMLPIMTFDWLCRMVAILIFIVSFIALIYRGKIDNKQQYEQFPMTKNQLFH